MPTPERLTETSVHSYKEDSIIAVPTNMFELVLRVRYNISQDDLIRFENIVQLAYNAGRVHGMEESHARIFSKS